MCCYQQEGWGNRSSATFLDDEGCIWRYESAAPLPDTEEARLAFLSETDGAVPVGQMDFWRMLELCSLIESAQSWQLEPQPAGAVDFGLNTYSAVRYGTDGRAEVIPLAVSGDRTAENPEPNAYALYVALFDEIMIYETANPTWLQPMNLPREPLAAFCGLEETIFEGATLTVTFSDPQSGECEYPLDEAIALLDREGLRQKVMQSMLQRIEEHVRARAGETLQTGVILFSNAHGFLGMTQGSEQILQRLLEEY